MISKLSENFCRCPIANKRIPVSTLEALIVIISLAALAIAIYRGREADALRSFLDKIIDHLPIAIFGKNESDLKFVLWNRASEEMFGLKSEQVLGKER